MHCPTSKIVLLALGSASVLLSASFKISFLVVVVVVVKSFNNYHTISKKYKSSAYFLSIMMKSLRPETRQWRL